MSGKTIVQTTVIYGARGLLTLSLALITYLALSPDPPPSAVVLWDKANHLLAFLVLSFFGDLSFSGRHWAKPIFAVLAAYGIALEGAQWLSGYRSPEMMDIVADVIGICLYLTIRPLLNRIAILRNIYSGDPE